MTIETGPAGTVTETQAWRVRRWGTALVLASAALLLASSVRIAWLKLAPAPELLAAA